MARAHTAVEDRGRAGRSATVRAAEARRVHRRRSWQVAGLVLVAMAALGVAVAGRAIPTSGGRASAPMVGAAVASAALAVAWRRRPEPDPERWWRGAQGEEATAARLDRLPSGRWAVLHDRRIPGSRANVDHILIGRRGVWVIDSKAYRAPLRAGWRSVRAGDRRIDTTAAHWEASVVSDRLGTEVRPLVVVHGRGLGRRGRRCDGAWVVPAEGMERRVRRERFGPRRGGSARRELADRCARVLPPA